MPLQVPHRQFAVLVAGPMSRVKTRSKELAKIMSTEIENHLADLIPEGMQRAAGGGEADRP
jgi:hypothetical protein